MSYVSYKSKLLNFISDETDFTLKEIKEMLDVIVKVQRSVHKLKLKPDTELDFFVIDKIATLFSKHFELENNTLLCWLADTQAEHGFTMKDTEHLRTVYYCLESLHETIERPFDDIKKVIANGKQASDYLEKTLQFIIDNET